MSKAKQIKEWAKARARALKDKITRKTKNKIEKKIDNKKI